MNIKLGLGAALLGASLLFGGAASAATCAAAYVNDVTGNKGDADPLTNSNSGCFVGSTNNDKLNPLQVNADDVFGTLDWTFAGKLLEPLEPDDPTPVNIGAAVVGGASGNTISGTWSVISNFFALYDELLIVMKGGNGNIDPDEYVAYLIKSVDGTAGNYSTPFANLDNQDGTRKNDAGISHISFYVRGDGDNGGGGTPPTIPLPAGMPLMLAGVGVMAFLARRKARKA